LLAIVQPANLSRRIQHHSGGKDWTEERPSAGFVDTGDAAESGTPGRTLVAAAGH
jgi:hypothetical protein